MLSVALHLLLSPEDKGITDVSGRCAILPLSLSAALDHATLSKNILLLASHALSITEHARTAMPTAQTGSGCRLRCLWSGGCALLGGQWFAEKSSSKADTARKKRKKRKKRE